MEFILCCVICLAIDLFLNYLIKKRKNKKENND